ncbi:hypothetical protein BH23PLA1_BH23PLA1_08660 [soil metagenome]
MKLTTILRLLATMLVLSFAAYALLAQYAFYGKWLLRYPLFVLLTLAILGVVYGKFGRGFGLSNLFWHERGPLQFRAGIWLGLLLTLQWCAAYELLRDFDSDKVFNDMRRFRNAALWLSESEANSYEIGRHLVPVDLREPVGIGATREVPPRSTPLLPSQLEEVQAKAKDYWSFQLLQGRFGDPNFEDVRSDEISDGEKRLEAWAISQRFHVFLTMTLLPLLGLLSLPTILPRSDRDGASRPGPRVKLGARGGWPFVAGLVLAGSLVWVVTPFVALGYVHILHSGALVGFMDSTLATNIGRLLELEGVAGKQNTPLFLEVALGQGGLILSLVGLLFFLRTRLIYQYVSPAMSLCLVLAIVSMGFAFLVNLSFWMPVTLLLSFPALVLGGLFLNGKAFKLRFPGLEAYYDRGRRVALAEAILPKTGVETPCRLLPSEIALECWAAANKARELPDKPKLALVSVSGGSIRSAFWTARVLAKLEEEIDGFPYHVRLVTGASGGMLGAAHYVSGLREPRQRDDGKWSRAPEELERYYKGLPADSLSPVARRLALFDMPSLLNPRTQSTDRGQALEEAWMASSGRLLRRPFRRLAPGEWRGWRPSLVFSPMLVEDGRRLIISNLDLDFLTTGIGSFLDAPERRKLPIDDPRAEHQDIYSISAYQFFRLFPEATDFRISTAVRMSATFPFISPAVSLPTNPPRRVVDAGYYDNFGINTAASWAFEHRLWLRENTSGVVLIQIRAFDSPRDIEEPDGDGRALRHGLQFLTSPLEGVLQARNAVMSFRNDEQVEVLSEWFRTNTGRSEFFQTAVFECPATASLSWHITKNEREDILSCIEPICRIDNGTLGECTKSEKNLRRLERLKQWWRTPIVPTRPLVPSPTPHFRLDQDRSTTHATHNQG